ncbi:hypothetical protein CKN82_11075 [Carnobacterium divergens]|uniref:Uncharacterized protein n=1 Tax=Carnobacterium divergens TaxID=2748 RepID=A0A4R9CLV3_CARDV|nr:DUF4352 domain-containing protein [Carnobacterium divergens]TFI66633.1 hypothetical protein CKN70_11230 [Carnobacterium divergens]TFI71662.1 hypothetical protein CKN58_11595 [Carnobacterium divergens]TFI76304.1 hypothetical protein CKN85_11650 [Carnobacterium divergens]TFI78927.1 hypothetical protein CKN68_11190 [Carnobacterium divergens]TFI82177.1 hypothetical protein CKN56_11680 [Carnobacterium divergens]
MKKFLPKINNDKLITLTKKQKLGWLLLVILVLIILIPVLITEYSSKEMKTNDEISNVGDTLTLGDFSYKVNNFEIRNSNDMEGRRDLIVSVDITSKSDKSETLSFENSFILKIGDKTFESDSIRSMNANSGSNPFSYNQVNPEQVIKGFVVFNISKEQAESKNVLLSIKESSFSSREATVGLK